MSGVARRSDSAMREDLGGREGWPVMVPSTPHSMPRSRKTCAQATSQRIAVSRSACWKE